MIKRHIRRIQHHARTHGPQFAKYLLSGGTAAGLELASYQIMLLLDIWYVTASVISGGVGLLSAFLLHKYVVFQKKEKSFNQAVRYAILQTWNFVAQTAIVYVLVEFAGVHPVVAKILGIGATVSWNFFLYKFLVYV